MKTFCIFGKKGTAIEIAETAKDVVPDWEIFFVIRDEEESESNRMVRDSDLAELLRKRVGDSRFIIPFSDGSGRMRCKEFAEELGLWPMSVIHPRAIVSPSAVVGRGCYLAPGVVVSSNAKVAPNSILNLNATFGHDAVSGEHMVVNPGAAISGGVTIGDRVLIGANSFVAAGVTVGNDCRVDALTYVGRDLEENQLCTSREMRLYPRRLSCE